MRRGVICLSAHREKCERKLLEEQYPDAESYCQQNPDLSKPGNFTRLTAAEAIKQLKEDGFSEDAISSPRSIANILNRNGYRLRSVIKVKPQKNSGNRRYSES